MKRSEIRPEARKAAEAFTPGDPDSDLGKLVSSVYRRGYEDGAVKALTYTDEDLDRAAESMADAIGPRFLGRRRLISMARTMTEVSLIAYGARKP